MALWSVKGKVWDSSKKGSPPAGATSIKEKNGKLVVSGTGRVIGFTSEKAAREYEREQRADAKIEKALLEKQRLIQIGELKKDVLLQLDAQLKGIPVKRLSARGQQKYLPMKEKLMAAKNVLSEGEGDIWYNKLNEYLQPTERKLNQLHRRLSTRPKIAR